MAIALLRWSTLITFTSLFVCAQRFFVFLFLPNSFPKKKPSNWALIPVYRFLLDSAICALLKVLYFYNIADGIFRWNFSSCNHTSAVKRILSTRTESRILNNVYIIPHIFTFIMAFFFSSFFSGGKLFNPHASHRINTWRKTSLIHSLFIDELMMSFKNAEQIHFHNSISSQHTNQLMCEFINDRLFRGFPRGREKITNVRDQKSR